MLKLAICGPSRSGKDECAKFIAKNSRLKYTGSTSEVITPHAAKRLGMTEAEAFACRHEHRELWLRLGIELRADDPAALARKQLKPGDLAVGIRDKDEMHAVLNESLVHTSIWVHRPGLPPDPTMKFGPELCTIILLNDEGIPRLHERLRSLLNAFGVLKAC